MPMKRKKWTEEEEETLLNAYSSSFCGSKKDVSAKLKIPASRQKRLQPVADRVNSLHHLSDPTAYPFLWSWRDVAIKIHNMRHQYLNVKHKILLLLPPPHPPNSDNNHPDFDSDRALLLWPNFLRYRQVFGDIDLESTRNCANQIDSQDDDDDKERRSRKKGKKKKRCWWRERARREERREEEEMEWMERVAVMQMEHEKQAMQMHADACQAQTQVLAILVRVLCQFVGPGPGGADGGLPLPNQMVVENLQQPQQLADDAEESEDGRAIAGG